MVDRHKRRVYLAYLLKDYLGLRKFLGLNDQLAGKAHAIAAADPALFEESFQEPMPSHLARALKVEIEKWADLRVGIDHLKDGDLSLDEFKAKAAKLREQIPALIATIQIEQDILQSPLVRTFERRLAEVHHL
jgi:hypothetical protein